MKQKTSDGKFTIEVKDEYLEGSEYTGEDGIATIKIFTEESSVTLNEVANAIISCTFLWGDSLDRVIDSSKFNRLNIYLEIKKSEDTHITYNFNIFNYQSSDEILPAIACDIRI